MSPAQTTTTCLPSVPEEMSSTSSTTALTPSETHSCPYNDCNKSFSKKYNLKAHLRLHTGEQPFECDRPDCRKKFKWRSSLSSHSVWHSRKDSANAATSTTKTGSPSSRPGTQQKACSTRVVRVAPHPSQRINMNNTSKKRPRSEMSASSSQSTQSLVLDHSRLNSSTRLKTKPATRSIGRKRRARPATCNKVGSELKQNGVEEGNMFATDVISAPGSPVTSDGSNSEQALDVDEFSCDLLQPLLTTDSEVGSIIGTEDGQLFGYDESVSCVPLSGFDSRFEQFDLDNFANFYLNKMEGL